MYDENAINECEVMIIIWTMNAEESVMGIKKEPKSHRCPCTGGQCVDSMEMHFETCLLSETFILTSFLLISSNNVLFLWDINLNHYSILSDRSSYIVLLIEIIYLPSAPQFLILVFKN